jgi:hypothetical protein
MIDPCPHEDELVLLVLGDATENRAAALRAHVARCTRCRASSDALGGLTKAVAAQVVATRVPERVAGILARLDEPAGAPARTIARPWAWSALSAVAAALVLVWLWPAAPAQHAFVARGGGAQGSLERRVGVTLLRAEAGLTPLASGATVSPETAYAVQYTNFGPDGSAYLMVFAIDTAGTLHWIEPAYLRPDDDPRSVRLSHAARRQLRPSAGVLDAPAAGPMRIVTLVTSTPLRVKDLDQGSAPSVRELRAQHPDAVIEELPVVVVPDLAAKDGRP